MKTIFFSLLIIFNLSSFAKKVNIATLEWPPYISSKLKGNGSVARIVTKAFEAVGYEVHFEFLPWARALSYIKSGRVDAIAPLYMAKDREIFLNYSNSFQDSSLVLFKRVSHDIQIEKMEDLLNYEIGLVKGYKNIKYIDSNTSLKKSFSLNDFLNLKKLLKSRVDLISIDREVARYLISRNKEKFKNKLMAIDPALDIKRLFLGVSKKTKLSKTILDDFNRGLKKIEHIIPQIINDSFSEIGMK